MPTCILAMDIDGVLVHPTTRRTADRWDEDIQGDLGIDPIELSRRFFSVYWKDIVLGRRDMKEMLAHVLPSLNSSVSVEEFTEYWFAHHARVDEAVVTALHKWRNTTGGMCIAVTNQEQYRVTYLLDQVGLGQLFDRVFWSGDLGVSKEKVSFYATVMRRIGCDPHCVLFFDDDQRNVAASRAAGWTSYHYTGLSVLHECLATTPHGLVLSSTLGRASHRRPRSRRASTVVAAGSLHAQ